MKRILILLAVSLPGLILMAGCSGAGSYPDGDSRYEAFAPDGIPCYVNAGVLLMDLDRFRAENLDLAAIKILHDHKLMMPDQDALNAVCAGRVKAVGCEYNSSGSCGISGTPKITHFAAVKNFTAGETWQEAAEALKKFRETLSGAPTCPPKN